MIGHETFRIGWRISENKMKLNWLLNWDYWKVIWLIGRNMSIIIWMQKSTSIMAYWIDLNGCLKRLKRIWSHSMECASVGTEWRAASRIEVNYCWWIIDDQYCWFIRSVDRRVILSFNPIKIATNWLAFARKLTLASASQSLDVQKRNAAQTNKHRENDCIRSGRHPLQFDPVQRLDEDSILQKIVCETNPPFRNGIWNNEVKMIIFILCSAVQCIAMNELMQCSLISLRHFNKISIRTS